MIVTATEEVHRRLQNSSRRNREKKSRNLEIGLFFFLKLFLPTDRRPEKIIIFVANRFVPAYIDWYRYWTIKVIVTLLVSINKRGHKIYNLCSAVLFHKREYGCAFEFLDSCSFCNRGFLRASGALYLVETLETCRGHSGFMGSRCKFYS